MQDDRGDPRHRATQRRIRRELETVEIMIALFCRAKHGAAKSELCAECLELRDYCRKRVRGCRFRREKPTCANCQAHCFSQTRREQIRAVMRYSGPRMLWRHPILALFHLVDGRRPAPPPRSQKGSPCGS